MNSGRLINYSKLRLRTIKNERKSIMDFKNVKRLLAENFLAKFPLNSTTSTLYEVDVDKDYLWNLYLDSFPEGTNPIYRERRYYDCSACRQFIKNIGGTVYIDETFTPHSIFEFDTHSEIFQPVMDALAAYVKSRPIIDIYLNDSNRVGIDKNRELLEDGTVHTWDHLHVNLPDYLVAKDYNISARKAQIRDRKNVFKRSLDEITMDAIDTVLELINSNTLYKGEEWKYAIGSLRDFKMTYLNIPDDKKDLYAWKTAKSISDVMGKIRNHSIGVLLVDISEGMELDGAVSRYEKIVAPTNYKRPKAIFTKKMLEAAKQTIYELGYTDSLNRRFATLDDITVNNILFSNRDVAKRIDGDIFDQMMGEVSIDPKRFSRVEEVSADKFVSDILPTAREVEVLLENRHAPNMVSLIAPENKDSKTMFKWNNGFSWAYSGNITDSTMRERVKSAGGNVDGVLRFSIQWNDTKEYSRNDVDAHCIEPTGHEIAYWQKGSYLTGGNLDVDIRFPRAGIAAVENIAYPSRNRMTRGKYEFFVHMYEHRGGRDGFRAEIEFDGNIYQYNYNKNMRHGEKVRVATVTLHDDGKFTIEHYLPTEAASRDIWGLKSNNFVPVSVIMYSPNYWDEQQGIGHRHYFFMLKDCINPEQPNGFYNEFLKHDLEQHKRVFEALGNKMSVVDADDQLSGIGFSATKRNDVVVKVKGATERVFKVKF